MQQESGLASTPGTSSSPSPSGTPTGRKVRRIPEWVGRGPGTSGIRSWLGWLARLHRENRMRPSPTDLAGLLVIGPQGGKDGGPDLSSRTGECRTFTLFGLDQARLTSDGAGFFSGYYVSGDTRGYFLTILRLERGTTSPSTSSKTS